jgi:hypothetical protein
MSFQGFIALAASDPTLTLVFITRGLAERREPGNRAFATLLCQEAIERRTVPGDRACRVGPTLHFKKA